MEGFSQVAGAQCPGGKPLQSEGHMGRVSPQMHTGVYCTDSVPAGVYCTDAVPAPPISSLTICSSCSFSQALVGFSLHLVEFL